MLGLILTACSASVAGTTDVARPDAGTDARSSHEAGRVIDAATTQDATPDARPPDAAPDAPTHVVDATPDVHTESGSGGAVGAGGSPPAAGGRVTVGTGGQAPAGTGGTRWTFPNPCTPIGQIQDCSDTPTCAGFATCVHGGSGPISDGVWDMSRCCP